MIDIIATLLIIFIFIKMLYHIMLYIGGYGFQDRIIILLIYIFSGIGLISTLYFTHNYLKEELQITIEFKKDK